MHTCPLSLSFLRAARMRSIVATLTPLRLAISGLLMLSPSIAHVFHAFSVFSFSVRLSLFFTLASSALSLASRQLQGGSTVTGTRSILSGANLWVLSLVYAAILL